MNCSRMFTFNLYHYYYYSHYSYYSSSSYYYYYQEEEEEEWGNTVRPNEKTQQFNTFEFF